MPVPIDATSIIIRIDSIDRNFAGGVDGFQTVVPNSTFCADPHIARVSFMREQDAEQFKKELEHYHLSEPDDFLTVRINMPFQEQILDWLSIARYEKATIAWLEGTEPTSIFAPEGWDPTEEPLRHYSQEELEERLEYLRSEDGVEVYRDKETGEEVFTARTKPRALQLFEEGVKLADPFIILDGRPPNETKGGTELNRAIEIFEQAVALEPEYWNAWWFLGKCWQALKNPAEALKAFKNSADTCGDDNPNVWREYMFECLNFGDADEGVRAADRAVEIAPEDDGLVSNQALAYLIAGRLKEAAVIAKKARKMNRRDPVTKNLQRMIKEVQRGKRPQPSTLPELEGR